MKIDNAFLLLIFLFSTNNFYSQNGNAYYKKQLSSQENHVSSEYIKQALKKLENQEYLLSFDKNLSLYKKIESLSVDDNPIVDAITQSIAEFSGEVYFDKRNQKIVHKKEFAGAVYLISKNIINWNLTKDTLKIDNYTCYKATTTRTIKNPEGEHLISITAWYSPKIPLPFGPDGYGGLPGLIVQLENNGTITTLKKIEFLEDDSIKIIEPNNGKKLTEKEFEHIVNETYNNRKNRY